MQQGVSCHPFWSMEWGNVWMASCAFLYLLENVMRDHDGWQAVPYFSSLGHAMGNHVNDGVDGNPPPVSSKQNRSAVATSAVCCVQASTLMKSLRLPFRAAQWTAFTVSLKCCLAAVPLLLLLLVLQASRNGQLWQGPMPAVTMWSPCYA